MMPYHHLKVLLLLGCSGAAGAQEIEPAGTDSAADPVVDETVPDEVILTPEETLNEALRIYQSGEPQRAQRLLALFVNDAAVVDESLRQRGRVYLGEVLYLQHNEEEARRVFESLLTLDPDYVIDPFEHPPDVCGFIETIRAYIRPPEQPAEALPAPPPPRSAYIGFGIYHFQHDERRLGAALAIAQTTFATISLVGFANLLDDREYWSSEEKREIQTRQGIQWGSTAAFYAIWAWSAIDAQRHWRTNVRFHTTPSKRERGVNDAIPGMHIELTIPTR